MTEVCLGKRLLSSLLQTSPCAYMPTPNRAKQHGLFGRLSLCSYWGSLLPHPSARGVVPDGAPSLTTAASLLDKLLPGQPELVDELLECIEEGMSWKRVSGCPLV